MRKENVRTLNPPRILIAAAKSGSGKTTLTCALLEALKSRGLSVRAFKCGPDYIDPMFHKTVIGISSYNLDSFLCGENGVREILKKNGAGADISVMEGVMGYYDGIAGISSEASAYDIARITDTPAVMILDCKGLSVSAVPCIQGFLHYKEDSRIKGVILNRLSPMMYGRMKEMIEVQTGIKVYGYVPVMKDCALESRYLGLKLPKERKDTEDKLTRLGEQILKSVDIAGLLELAENAPELQEKKTQGYTSEMVENLAENAQYSTESVRTKDTVRIGLASDDAFCFFYQDNLELLQEMGAELIPFSPLYDKQIPENLSLLPMISRDFICYTQMEQRPRAFSRDRYIFHMQKMIRFLKDNRIRYLENMFFSELQDYAQSEPQKFWEYLHIFFDAVVTVSDSRDLSFVMEKISSEGFIEDSKQQQEMIHQILIDCRTDEEESTDTSMDQILKIMREEYTSDLSQAEIAQRMGMTQTYFSRMFKNKTGKNFVSLLTEFRMNHAKELIAKEYDITISELAEKCGYTSKTYFCALFRKTVGLTVNEYRRRLENER